MIPGLPLAFAQPLVLLGLLSLPILWWLLRLVPPRPRRINFPPTRLLFEIAPKEETPSRTPWWLTLLRLTLAALIIIAAAGPLWNPPLAASNRGAPLLILLDDGWAAAASWDERLRTADELIARADADNRGVAVLPLSETGRNISLQLAGAARVQIKQLKPKPYGVNRSEALALIDRFLKAAPDVELVWLSDGVDLGKGGEFVAGLKNIIGNHPLTIVDRRAAGCARTRRRRQRSRRADGESAARADRRRRQRHRERHRPQGACRSARRGSRSPPTRAKPMR